MYTGPLPPSSSSASPSRPSRKRSSFTGSVRTSAVERKHLKRNAIIKWLIVAYAICGAVASVGAHVP
ncbi:hypothetical protein JCM10207_004174 [Rhodosporidiobolus poonsookiae]